MNGSIISRHAIKSTQMGLFHANYTLNPASGMSATIINDQSDEYSASAGVIRWHVTTSLEQS